MATYIWVRGGGTPLRRKPLADERDVWKQCDKCGHQSSRSRRLCVACREPLQVRRVKRAKPDLDAQLRGADLQIAAWHRKARIALGRIVKWTQVRNRVMRKQILEARAAGNQDRALLIRPARRALRVRSSEK